MSGIHTGRCQCGAIEYELGGEPLAVVACHCTQCQRQSGSAFSMSMVVRRDALQLRGTPRTHRIHSDSGAIKDCVFCGECGTRIYNENEAFPDTLNLKPGTLDDTSWLSPAMHVWTASKQPWVPIPEGARCFDHNPKRG